MFVLDEKLRRDCYAIGDLPLCSVLLMDDATWPWLILVPRNEGVTEIFELGDDDRRQLTEESCAVAAWLSHRFGADKINVAALGNIVRQLHVHHLARFRDDPAWPGPVWGVQAPVPYTKEQLAGLCGVFAEFGALPGFRPDRGFFRNR